MALSRYCKQSAWMRYLIDYKFSTRKKNLNSAYLENIFLMLELSQLKSSLERQVESSYFMQITRVQSFSAATRVFQH